MPWTIGLASGESFTVAELADVSNNPACRFIIYNDAGTNKWTAEFYDTNEGDNWITCAYQSFTVQQWLESIELKYDTDAGEYELRSNGSTIASGSLVGSTRTPRKCNIGIIGNPNSNTSRVYIDKVVWRTDDWQQSASGVIHRNIGPGVGHGIGIGL